MYKNKLLIVTVTYNPDIEELDLFIQSFFKYNDLDDCARLVVVDNSPESNDSCKRIVSKYSAVSYVPNPSNPGFGASNNIGFHEYDSDYVLFINNDVEFTEPVFMNIISIMETDESIGCVGIHQNGCAPSFFNKMTAPKNTQLDKFDENVHFISGAFMFFKSDVFEKIGMFDENLFMYFEEFDLSERLIKNGFHTAFLPNLSFLHKVGNRKIINEKVWIKSIPSFCYICKKYNIDPVVHSKSIMRRLRLLFLYSIITLQWKNAAKVFHVYKARKQIVYKEFGVKI